jgi:hypothetical protein
MPCCIHALGLDVPSIATRLLGVSAIALKNQQSVLGDIHSAGCAGSSWGQHCGFFSAISAKFAQNFKIVL